MYIVDFFVCFVHLYNIILCHNFPLLISYMIPTSSVDTVKSVRIPVYWFLCPIVIYYLIGNVILRWPTKRNDLFYDLLSLFRLNSRYWKLIKKDWSWN